MKSVSLVCHSFLLELLSCLSFSSNEELNVLRDVFPAWKFDSASFVHKLPSTGLHFSTLQKSYPFTCYYCIKTTEVMNQLHEALMFLIWSWRAGATFRRIGVFFSVFHFLRRMHRNLHSDALSWACWTATANVSSLVHFPYSYHHKLPLLFDYGVSYSFRSAPQKACSTNKESKTSKSQNNTQDQITLSLSSRQSHEADRLTWLTRGGDALM